MNIYDLVLRLLQEDKDLRNSDKKLMWKVWELQRQNDNNLHWSEDYEMLKDWFIKDAITPESITRARRKVQEEHPELRAHEAVEAMRREKELDQGTFIFREEADGQFGF